MNIINFSLYADNRGANLSICMRENRSKSVWSLLPSKFDFMRSILSISRFWTIIFKPANRHQLESLYFRHSNVLFIMSLFFLNVLSMQSLDVILLHLFMVFSNATMCLKSLNSCNHFRTWYSILMIFLDVTIKYYFSLIFNAVIVCIHNHFWCQLKPYSLIMSQMLFHRKQSDLL